MGESFLNVCRRALRALFAKSEHFTGDIRHNGISLYPLK